MPLDDDDNTATGGFTSLFGQPPINDVEGAKGYLSRLGAERKGYMSTYDKSMGNREGRIENIRAMLKAATDRLRQGREGEMNVPALAMAAGLLGPTRAGSTAEGVSAGLQGMIPAINQNRTRDENLINLETQRDVLPDQMMLDVDSDRAKQAATMANSTRGNEASVERALLSAQARVDAAKVKDGTVMDWRRIHAAAKAQFDAIYKDRKFNTPQEAKDAYDAVLKSILTELGPRRPQTPDTMAPPVGTGSPLVTPPVVMPPARGKDDLIGIPQSTLDAARDLGLPDAPTVRTDAGLPDKEKAEVRRKALMDWNHAEKDRSIALGNTQEELRELQQAEAYNAKMANSPASALAWNVSPEARAFKALQDKISQKQRVPGTGSVSDFDAKMFQGMVPGPDKPQAANDDIIKFRRTALQMETALSEFRSAYMRHYQTLDGADDAWRKYVNSNQGQILVPDADGKSTTLNPAWVPWQEFFKASRARPRIDMRRQ